MKDLQINYKYASSYINDSGIKLSKLETKTLVNKFTKWERKYVYSLPNGYQDYRENVIWLDYDEIIEAYINYAANNFSFYPKGNCKAKEIIYLNNVILPQIESF